MTKGIMLRGGEITIVDDDIYEVVRRNRWHVSERGYVRRRFTDGRVQFLHRFILNPSDEFVVDHVDGNKLNNTRENLRLASKGQNRANSTYVKGSSSYKGVTLRMRQKGPVWQAAIFTNKKCRYLGLYQNEVEAALAYDKAAIELWGEFARLNFPGDMAQSVSAAGDFSK